MRHQKKLTLAVMLVMLLILMMSVTGLADENVEDNSGNTGSLSFLQNVLGGNELKNADLNGLNLNGVDFNSIDINGINPAGIDLSGIDINALGLQATDIQDTAVVNEKITEYLKSLGYADEDIEKLKSVLLESFNTQISQAVNAALSGKDTAEDASQEQLQETQAEPQIYVVKRGDNLSKIAKNVYGDSGEWTVLYELNKDQIRNPNEIEIGQILIIG